MGLSPFTSFFISNKDIEIFPDYQLHCNTEEKKNSMLEGKNAYARASLIPQVILLHEKEIRLLASVLHA